MVPTASCLSYGYRMPSSIPPTNLDRLWNSFRALVRAESPTLTFAGIYEYGIQAVHGTAPSATVDCSPTDTTIPLPPLVNIPMRSAVDGTTVTPTIGSNCLVMFVNADPSRPVVFGVDPISAMVKVQATAEIDISAPAVNIANGVLPAARQTDLVVAGPFMGTITSGSTKVVVG